MRVRIRRRIQFLLERLVVRGPLYRLLLVAAMLALVSVVGGALVFGSGSFGTFGEAVWWAFLRLSDPGYLGDDEGVWRRTVSTVVTVLGYVIFLGALVAIMIQWFNAKMRTLEQGLTPIAQKGHVLLLGWTNRTPEILRELLRSEERVRRFLSRRGTRRLHVIILADDVSAQRVQDLRDRLGALWTTRFITFRSGSALRLEHLRRVDFTRASAILLPGADYGEGGADAADTRTVKTLLSIAHAVRNDATDEAPPLVVAELFDNRKGSVARAAYRGSLEILASDHMVARLVAQTVRHPGMSHVFSEILAHGEGNEIYIREVPELIGKRVQSMYAAFPRAIPLGVVRSERGRFIAHVDPTEDPVMERGDRVVFLAPDSDALAMEGDETESYAEERPAPRAATLPRRRVLVLGWSHRVAALLVELEGFRQEHFDVDVVSMVSVAERDDLLEHYDLTSGRVVVRQLELDYTVPFDLSRIDVESYDNAVFFASDWLDTGEESDARTIAGELLFEEVVRGRRRPSVLVELADPENEPLLQTEGTEVLVSPLILSHMLAQVTLRRELHAVFDALFGSGGGEVFFRPAGEYDLVGREVAFREVQRAADAKGEVAIGIRRAASAWGVRGGVELNPSRHDSWSLSEGDDVVVLTAY